MSQNIQLYEGIQVTGLSLSRYLTNGAMGVIALMETDEGIEQEAISINLSDGQILEGDRELEPDCFFAKNFEEGETLVAALIKEGWIETTGHDATFNGLGGPVIVPVCRLTRLGESMVNADYRTGHADGPDPVPAEESECADWEDTDDDGLDEESDGRPSNRQQWWSAVDGNWEELQAICGRFLELDQPAAERPFGFGGGRAMYKPVAADNPKVAASLREDMLRCKRDRDPRLSLYLHAAWAEAPDEMSIHRIPGWGSLCKLCETSSQCLND